MKDKELAFVRIADADSQAQELVSAIQSILSESTIDLSQLRLSLVALLSYLSSKEGRTDRNCSAVDQFFMFNELWVERNLPEPFHDIFADMSGALHDTISSPDIAANFESTPEQLLLRARNINVTGMGPR